MRARVAAGVVSVLLLAAASSPGELFEKIHAVKWPKGTYGYRGAMGDFLLLKDGSILMSYTQDGVGIMAVRSADQGRTWGQPSMLVPMPKPPAKGYFAHPSFLRVANGEVLLSYIYSTYPTTPYFGHNYCRRSADEGKTWTDPFIMTPYPGYVLVHNDRLSTLSSGRIVAPAEYKAHLPRTNDHEGYVGMTFYSDDQGHSWQASKNTVDLYGDGKHIEVQEADVVELKDGRLMMFARTYSGFPVRAYSSDKGESWSKGEPVRELKMPCAGLPTVRRIPSTGDLLFLWIGERSVDKHDSRIQRRCALSAAISRDEGKTFEHFRYIARDPEDDFGYQCVEFVGKDLALVGFHARDGLHVARIGIDWFYGVTGTFSIVAADPATGECGAAVASKFPAVGRVVPYARAGVGAFCTQHWHNPPWGEQALGLLAQGKPPEDVLAELLRGDANREKRQLAVIDMQGRAVTRNPSNADPSGVYWGAMAGRYYACQGNTLTGRDVVVAMGQGYEETAGSLADRLMAALVAADRAGGDHRGRLAAGIRVCKKGVSGYWLELYVDDHPDAVTELARQYAALKHDAKGKSPQKNP